MIERGLRGFSLLELQIAILLMAFLIAGLTTSVSLQVNQVHWMEALDFSGGTTAPMGLFSIIREQALEPTPTPSGRYEVEILQLDVSKYKGKPCGYTATLYRRAAAAGDCGY